MRKYNIPDALIGGDKNCDHDFNTIHRPLRDTSGMPSNNSILAVKQIEGVESTRNIFYGICNKCGCFKGQYGVEPKFIGEHSYLEHTKLWMQEAVRCLKDDGILFINVADSYYGGGKWNNGGKLNIPIESMPEGTNFKTNKYKSKCKCLIPERIAIMAVDELGLIHRNTIIWRKINHMPCSVTDRFTDSYEHILMFVKNQKYQFFLDPIREPHKQVSIDRLKRAISDNNKWVDGADGQTRHGLSQPRPNTTRKDDVNTEDLFDNDDFDTINGENNRGANTGENSKEPYKQNNPHRIRLKEYKGKHVNREYTGRWDDGNSMAMPEKWHNPKGKNPSDYYSVDDIFEIATQPSSEKHFAMFPEKLIRRLILCSTKIGDTVLDPFAGNGTMLKVAEELNRIGCGIELGYQDIQQRRLINIQKELPL